jgi:hypothetical protein
MSAQRGTVVAQPLLERVLYWVGFPVVGTGLGWLLQATAGWLLGLPWVPFQGPLRLVESIPQPQLTIGALAVGALAGLVVAHLGAQEYVTVAVDSDQVTIRQGDKTRVAGRGSVSAVFVDAKQLVLLGRSTQELIRQRGDLPNAARLEAAFTAHGYPWRSADPFDGDYRRWVPDSPDLPGEAHALFKARSRALEKDDKEDAAELREELSRLGLVVRDHGAGGKRQTYRRTTE